MYCCVTMQLTQRLPLQHPAALSPERLLRVLQCVRLLSRDDSLRRRMVETGAVQVQF